MKHNKYISLDTLIFYCRLYNFLGKYNMHRHIENMLEEQEDYLDLIEYLVNNTAREISFHDFLALADACSETHGSKRRVKKAYRRDLRKWREW